MVLMYIFTQLDLHRTRQMLNGEVRKTPCSRADLASLG